VPNLLTGNVDAAVVHSKIVLPIKSYVSSIEEERETP
jgi:hypothetical protein